MSPKNPLIVKWTRQLVPLQFELSTTELQLLLNHTANVWSNDIDPGMPAEGLATRPMPHHAPRPVGIPRPAVHDIHGHVAALTHHHRPAFHRTGRRH